MGGSSGCPDSGPSLCSGYAAGTLPGHHCSLPGHCHEEGDVFPPHVCYTRAWVLCARHVHRAPQPAWAQTLSESMSQKTAFLWVFRSGNAALSR